jgi:hypothetical protein
MKREREPDRKPAFGVYIPVDVPASLAEVHAQSCRARRSVSRHRLHPRTSIWTHPRHRARAAGGILPASNDALQSRRSTPTTLSDGKGEFWAISAGTYTVTARCASIRGRHCGGATGHPGVAITMNVGKVAEAITVTGVAPTINAQSSRYAGALPAPGSFNTEAYDKIDDNGWFTVTQKPLSTFSTDVDTASYANVRRFLNKGTLPPKDSVRIGLLNFTTTPSQLAAAVCRHDAIGDARGTRPSTRADRPQARRADEYAATQPGLSRRCLGSMEPEKLPLVKALSPCWRNPTSAIASRSWSTGAAGVRRRHPGRRSDGGRSARPPSRRFDQRAGHDARTTSRERVSSPAA